jgi:hypothetical protein
MTTEQDKYNLGRITGAKQIIGRFNIPAKCKFCGKIIFLYQMPPEGFTEICVICAIREINQSSEQHPDAVKDMVLDGYMQMQRAGF